MTVDHAGTDQKKITGVLNSIVSKGLTRTLLLWFLALALIPVSAVGIISYLNAYRSLKELAEGSLQSTSKIRTDQIHSYFSRMLTDLRSLSEKKSNVQFLEDLQSAFRESNRPLRDFVKSFEWHAIAEQYGVDLRNYLRTYGDHEIFLIDREGNILFSGMPKDDFGTNLFHGKYTDSLFAKACRKSLETGAPTFSDFEFYPPLDNAVVSFLVSAVINENGDKIGLMALQMQADQIDSIMRENAGMGKTEEAYLIGTDLRMRSNSILAEEATILKKRVDTEVARLWYREHVTKTVEQPEEEERVLIYDGPHGERVLGLHRPMTIAGVPFAVIAEIGEAEAFAPANRLRPLVTTLLIATGLLVFFIAVLISRRIVHPLHELAEVTQLVAAGRLDQEIEINSRNEIGKLAQGFNDMLRSLRHTTEENKKQDWLKTGQAELSDRIRGDQDLPLLCRTTITFLAEYLKAQIGAIYLAEDDTRLRLFGSYAFKKRKNLSNEFALGEGLVGQAALEKESIVLTHVPDDYIAVSSGLGEAVPRNIVVVPFLSDGGVMGVIELGTFEEFPATSLDFLKQVTNRIAVAVQSAQSRRRVQELLEESQTQAEVLEAQQEELRQSHEELEEHANALKKSEEGLKIHREQLQQTNEELEEQTQLLEEQKEAVQKKNVELEKSQALIEEKAEELEIASKYKSEFLANMSHELRTPLNSILLLSKLLSENRSSNLTEKQEEFAETIHASGSELLALINEVLDLSKVEAGKMDLDISEFKPGDFKGRMERYFGSLAEEKGLKFRIRLEGGIPDPIYTDPQKMEQIVKNLLSNAFKFTSQGSVTLSIGRPNGQSDLSRSGLDKKKTIAFSVTDTGEGIPRDKQKVIFEAFQQADGTTSRKHGGTGLGLSISKELAKFLGGEIQVESEEGKGSTFTLYLPETAENETKTEESPPKQEVTERQEEPSERPLEPPDIRDDRKELRPGDKSILIIEDDATFVKILCDLSREKGFKFLVAGNGETGLHLADYYKPSAIILDIGLPGMDGWAVMSRLKDNSETRHIPVHFISASDRNLDAMKMGAVGYLTKPVSMEKLERAYGKIEQIISKPVKDLLVVEHDEKQRKAINDLMADEDVLVTAVSTGREAYDLLTSRKFDCVILDLGLPDMSGVELLTKIKKDEDLMQTPVIVYTGGDLTKQEKITLDKYSESIIIKGAKSPERLFAEASLFLHRVEENLPQEKREMLRLIHDKELILKDKKILVVDDDMRNVFALTHILEEREMQVLVGKNGKEALERLERDPDVNLVIMDIMMPEMDGYEAMREIRKQERFNGLPIIALTAKAMRGDRIKCIESGASDYLSKPVDKDKLLSMLRVWLYEQRQPVRPSSLAGAI